MFKSENVFNPGGSLNEQHCGTEGKEAAYRALTWDSSRDLECESHWAKVGHYLCPKVSAWRGRAVMYYCIACYQTLHLLGLLMDFTVMCLFYKVKVGTDNASVLHVKSLKWDCKAVPHEKPAEQSQETIGPLTGASL